AAASSANVRPWGVFLSEYPENHPHLKLTKSVSTIGRSARCNFQLNDPSLSNLVCRVNKGAKIGNGDGAGATLVRLDVCTGSSVITVNGAAVRKGTSATMRAGDTLVIQGS
ncbi:unnamed protein product, partial [Phaeothamnion confervicola]